MFFGPPGILTGLHGEDVSHLLVRPDLYQGRPLVRCQPAAVAVRVVSTATYTTAHSQPRCLHSRALCCESYVTSALRIALDLHQYIEARQTQSREWKSTVILKYRFTLSRQDSPTSAIFSINSKFARTAENSYFQDVEVDYFCMELGT